jgi:hypothetical protein
MIYYTVSCRVSLIYYEYAVSYRVQYLLHALGVDALVSSRRRRRRRGRRRCRRRRRGRGGAVGVAEGLGKATWWMGSNGYMMVWWIGSKRRKGGKCRTEVSECMDLG